MHTWKYLGFGRSPYDADPLTASAEDVELLVGREDEMTQLCTTLAGATRGALIISGPPGVGKTSFFNVSQYLLESSQTAIGPHLMCARKLCAVRNEDKPIDVARRSLSSLVRSVESYCSQSSRSVPPQTAKLKDWLGDVGSGGVQLGVSVLGCGGSVGRSVVLPKFGDATFERVADAIECVSSEVVHVLGFEGAFIVLDNLENLDDEHASNLLMSLRDTLFACPNIWWVLIGQAGFGGLMQSLNPRVYERISGSAIELKPIGLKSLHEAIEKRVQRFHEDGVRKAPLDEAVHRHLYAASLGEIRFVFKYSSDVCLKVVAAIVRSIVVSGRTSNRQVVETDVLKALGRVLVNDQIPAGRAELALRMLIGDEFANLKLKTKEIEVLKLIGERGSARAGQYRLFGLKSMQDFSSHYLVKMYKQNLLIRAQAGTAVLYKLRGVAALANEYGLLKRTLATPAG